MTPVPRCVAGHRWMEGTPYCKFFDATYFGVEDEEWADMHEMDGVHYG